MNSQKLFIFILSLNIFLSTSVFAKNYKISKIEYDITKSSLSLTGKTQIYALEQKVKCNTDKIFENEEDFQEYLDLYKQQLENTRAFDNIVILKEIDDSIDHEITTTNDIEYIKLKINLIDSNHLLVVPHVISYNSNEGWKPKFKIKDMNFLGAMNPLSADIYFKIPFDSDENKTEIGTTLNYDYPFHLGIFNAIWVNDYTISYASGDYSPEWDLKTGLNISYPYKNFSFDLEFYQKANRNFDYKVFDDEVYFNENGTFSVPIKFTKLDLLSGITYKPYFSASVNWDVNGISKENTNLSSPTFTLGHKLFSSNINWYNNFRYGFSYNIENTFTYNLQRDTLQPAIQGELIYYHSFPLWDYNFLNEIGILTRIYAENIFTKTDNPYFSTDGIAIGDRLRGIRDEQCYFNTDIKACTTISAFVLNIDIPVRIFKTYFSKKLINYFNFDLQVSPFIDIALTHNKITNKYFDPKDGFYASGVEVLVYPKKFSSFIVRGSIGLDMGKLLLKNYINMDWRANNSPYEISFGIGLQY